MGYFSSLRLFRFSTHDMNMRTAHIVDFCMFFMIAFLDASTSSFETGTKCCFRIIGRERFLSGTKLSSGDLERPRNFRTALSKLVAKARQRSSLFELAHSYKFKIKLPEITSLNNDLVVMVYIIWTIVKSVYVWLGVYLPANFPWPWSRVVYLAYTPPYYCLYITCL